MHQKQRLFQGQVRKLSNSEEIGRQGYVMILHIPVKGMNGHAKNQYFFVV